MVDSVIIFDKEKIYNLYECDFTTNNQHCFKRRMIISNEWSAKEINNYLKQNVVDFKSCMIFSDKILCLTTLEDIEKHDKKIEGKSKGNFIDKDWRDMGYFFADGTIEVKGIEKNIEIECIAPDDIEKEELEKRICESTSYKLKIRLVDLFADCWLKK
ncbi:hypothetical protein ACQ3MN_07735 [Enterococcus faecalis]|uniref:hypothetical protein n=1 Tax=Enterococcus faecalis TaxID=1351 RepID=UPI003D773F20